MVAETSHKLGMDVEEIASNLCCQELSLEISKRDLCPVGKSALHHPHAAKHMSLNTSLVEKALKS